VDPSDRKAFRSYAIARRIPNGAARAKFFPDRVWLALPGNRSQNCGSGVGLLVTRFLIIAAVWICASCSPAQTQVADFAAQRERMVKEQIVMRGLVTERVLSALRKVPREEFVPADYRWESYRDKALPIGYDQTISQPFIVAFMTEELQPQPTDRVLEVGTGSGYQAAILAELVAEVYSIEIIAPLAKTAETTLRRLGYKNVHVKTGDGYKGWPEHAPFDSIIVTCAPERVPQPLLDQLKEGGRMIIPVGAKFAQELYLFEKKNGRLQQSAVLPVRFVPMVREEEEKKVNSER
jgi:protein-L-isoaspartate(D-aspartate) O-methyltransferase